MLTEEVQQNRKTIGKLTEEVIAVKLENRKHHNSIAFKNNPKFDKLPFMLKDDLNAFNSELEKDKEFLDDFVSILKRCIPSHIFMLLFLLIVFCHRKILLEILVAMDRRSSLEVP